MFVQWLAVGYNSPRIKPIHSSASPLSHTRQPQIMDRKTKVTNIYLALLLPAGIGVVGLALSAIDIGRANLGLLVLAAMTLVFGSYLRIQLPRTKIHLTLSDTLIFLIFILYGAPVAVIIGTVEAIVSSLNFRRSGVAMSTKTIIINTIVTPLSIASMAIAVGLVFGDPQTVLDGTTVREMIFVLSGMALAQFVANSVLVSIFISIRSGETLWHVWSEYCLNALVIYLTGAVMAGILYTALSQIEPILLLAVAGFFALVYFTYFRYVNEIRRTAATAEEAERKRAEQAEVHLTELQHYVGELERTAHALRESREKFRHAAYHDALTGLGNRNHILELLDPIIERHSDTGKFALLFLDLNRFKTVNDSLGHSAGDLLIKQVARRLKQAVGESGTVGRMSGDEFVILITDEDCAENIETLAQTISVRISEPYDLEGRLIFTSVSIGIAIGPGKYGEAEEVLRDADIAMYYAKENGAKFVIFDQIMHARAVSLLELETDLRLAVVEHQFELFYQPLVDLHDASLVGFEALVRWNHPSRGLITPGEFISVAESTGLIIPMTLQLLEQACSQTARWIGDGIAKRSITVSVNISAGHLEERGFVGDLHDILNKTGLPAANLKLEITESAVMENAEAAIEILKAVKDLGVKLSIDDFGTGYSSLSYLHRLPIDTLKVDRSFVSSMDDSTENAEIVRTVIALANSLNLSVIAEGIESMDQYYGLRRLGCEYGQGYLFSRPVPARDAGMMLGSSGPSWANLVVPPALGEFSHAEISHQGVH